MKFSINKQGDFFSQLTCQTSPGIEFKEDSYLTKLVVDHSKDAILCIDYQGKIVYANRTACLLIQLPQDKLLSFHVDEINLCFLNYNWQEYWQLFKQHGSWYLTSCQINHNSQQKSWEITGSYLKDSHQEYACIIARDLTKYQQIQSSFTQINHHKEKKETQVKKVYFSTKSHSRNDSFFPNSSELKNSAELKAVFQFIEENYQQPITLSDVAEAVGYSPAYLTHLVKRRTKRSILNWIMERRMFEARQLLVNTEQSVTQIAAIVGYSDACYFSRRFTQIHQIPPKVWREQYRVDQL